MNKKDHSGEDFGYEIVSPSRRGLTLTRSVYIATLIVLAFALVSAAELNELITHAQIVNIPPYTDEMKLFTQTWGSNPAIVTPTPMPSSMPLSEFSGDQYHRKLMVTALSTMIMWPVIAWGLNQISGAFFGGTGKFYPDMLAGIGYTYVMKVVAGIIAVVLISRMPVFAIDYMQLSSDASITADYIGHILNNSPYYQLSYYIRWAGLILACGYGVLVVKKVEKIKLWQATIVVGVPLLVYIVLNYFGFFNLL